MSENIIAGIISALAQANYESGNSGKFVKWLKNGSNQETHFEKASNRAVAIVSDDKFVAFAEERIKSSAEKYLAEQLSRKTGLEVEEISEEGVAKAIGKRAGIDLHSLSDRKIIEADLTAAATALIFAYAGWVAEEKIETVEQLMIELELRAIAEIEKRVPDLVLHKLEQIEKDVAAWATKKIREKTGVPITDINDIDKTKKEVVDWAFNAVRRRLHIKGTGGGLKMNAKAVRNRRAQRRFYAEHGNRKKYTGVSGGGNT